MNVDRISPQSQAEVESLFQKETLDETKKLVLMVAAVTTVVAIALLFTKIGQFTQLSQLTSFALQGALPITVTTIVIDFSMLAIYCVASVKACLIEQQKEQEQEAESNQQQMIKLLKETRESIHKSEETSHTSKEIPTNTTLPPKSPVKPQGTPEAAPLTLPQSQTPPPPVLTTSPPPPFSTTVAHNLLPPPPVAVASAVVEKKPARLNPLQLYQEQISPLLDLTDELFLSLIQLEFNAEPSKRKIDELRAQLKDFAAGSQFVRAEISKYLGVNGNNWDPHVFVSHFVAAHFAPPFPDGAGPKLSEFYLYQWVKVPGLSKDKKIAEKFKQEFENSVSFNRMSDLRQLFKGSIELNEAFLNRFLGGLDQALAHTGNEASRLIVANVINQLRREAPRLIALPSVQRSFQNLAQNHGDARQFQVALSPLPSHLVQSLSNNEFSERTSEEIIQGIWEMSFFRKELLPILPDLLKKAGEAMEKIGKDLGDLLNILNVVDNALNEGELWFLGLDPKDPSVTQWAREVLSRESKANDGRYEFKDRPHTLPQGSGAEKMGEKEYRSLMGRGPSAGANWAVDPFAKAYCDQFEKYHGKAALEKRIKNLSEEPLFGSNIRKEGTRYVVKVPKTLPRVMLLLLDKGKGSSSMTQAQYRNLIFSDERVKACFAYFAETHGAEAAEELIKEFGERVETITIDGQTRYGIYVPSSRFNWVVASDIGWLKALIMIFGPLARFPDGAPTYIKGQVDGIIEGVMQWLNTFPLLSSFIEPVMKKFWDALALSFIAGAKKPYFKNIFKNLFFDKMQAGAAELEAEVRKEGDKLAMQDILNLLKQQLKVTSQGLKKESDRFKVRV